MASSYIYGSAPVTAGRDPTSYLYDFDKAAKSSNWQYGRSYATVDNLIDYYDVSRIPDLDNIPMPYIGHIIFTRPSLFIDTGLNTSAGVSIDGDVAKTNYEAMQLNSLTAGWINDVTGRKMAHMLSEFNSSPYIPLFTNRARTYSTNDVSIKTLEKGHTFFGHFIKYGKHSEEHKKAGTISIEFQNDYQHTIMKAIWLWMAYIMIVSKSGSIAPSTRSQQYGIIDYAGSIYYLVTRMNGSELVYWEKLTGVFPISIPFSMFSYNNAVWTEDKLNIDFDYALRSDPNDPNVLMDLNVLSTPNGDQNPTKIMRGGVTAETAPNYRTNVLRRTNQVRPDGFQGGGFGLGSQFAACPVIQMRIHDDKTRSFHLQWAKRFITTTYA